MSTEDRFALVKERLSPVLRDVTGRTAMWPYADDVRWLIQEVERLSSQSSSNKGDSK